MKILCAASVVAISAIAGASSAAPVNLSTWAAAEGGGNWAIAADNNSVFQSINTPTPTVFHNGVDSQGLSLSGEITVETTIDDDYIGFVLGYNAGDLGSPSADYLLIDWKQTDQSAFSAFADVGLAISRVTGAIDNTQAWGHSGDVTELARANTLGSAGWADNTTYAFDLIFTADLVQVFVDNVLELSVAGSFENGSFGFYNFSQASVRYGALQEVVVPPNPPTPGVIPLPAAGWLLLGGVGGLVALRRTKTDRAN